MQIAPSNIQVERGGKFIETSFDIGDSRLIIEMLRKNVYSNPIRSLVQEVMSNGRDAHREINKDSLPIKIHIPNKMNPNWTCQDWGPGIDPTRMLEVFIKYGNSTKRGTGKHATDNGLKQTGGFGIGCKSPFAYTDSFSIVTKAMEGNVLVERTYMAIIAEDNTNKLMELEDSMRIIDPLDSSLDDSDKITGTTIIVPVKEKEFNEFKSCTIDVVKYWNPRPNITDIDDVIWPCLDPIYSGTNWRILNKEKNREVCSYAIIDGIAYKIDPRAINQTDYDTHKFLDHNIVLIDFDISELSLPQNREAIHYDDPTKEKLKSRINDIISGLNEIVNNEIKSCKSLWEATCKLQDFNKIHGLGKIKPEWISPTGKKIIIGGDNLYCDHYHDHIKVITKDSSFIGKFRSKYNGTLKIHTATKFIINDEDKLSRLKIETLFDIYPQLESLQVLDSNDQLEIKWWKDHNHLDYLEPIYLSQVQKKIKPRTPSNRTNVTNKIYLFGDANWWPANVNFDTDSGIYCEFNRTGSINYSNEQITIIRKVLNITIYGIPTRFMEGMEEYDNWTNLDSEIVKYFNNTFANFNINDLSFKENGQNVNIFGSSFLNFYNEYNRLKLSEKIEDPEFLEYITLSNEWKNINIDNNFRFFYKLIHKNDINLEKDAKSIRLIELHNTLTSKYVLLTKVLPSYYTNSIDTPAEIKDLIWYINNKKDS